MVALGSTVRTSGKGSHARDLITSTLPSGE